MSAISDDIRSPSWIPTSRNQLVSSLANGVASRADLHDQSNGFCSTNSSASCLGDRTKAERRYVSATCLIWPGGELLPKEVVGRAAGNAGSPTVKKRLSATLLTSDFSELRLFLERRKGTTKDIQNRPLQDLISYPSFF